MGDVMAVRWCVRRWVAVRGALSRRREAGMATAEYAVGTIVILGNQEP
ncbi:DUF4244 domain-containing protein [Streptomyces zagrosensis]|uniref:DUF4244 domain-containing protein n=1 Tax=Streptomyces zagrosensis TaxID=1042984 RepID=A0A7W9V339_9ACTN|nr:DUF4244 domain-containing protein [Streptomyces zagrosensis]MBB5939509.1 hypothetical protein [Streptomyces zagrosensis]